MKDERIDELVTRYHEALQGRIRDHLQDRFKSILIMCKRRFSRKSGKTKRRVKISQARALFFVSMFSLHVLA